jgi:hypothetical protein
MTKTLTVATIAKAHNIYTEDVSELIFELEKRRLEAKSKVEDNKLNKIPSYAWVDEYDEDDEEFDTDPYEFADALQCLKDLEEELEFLRQQSA